jgi:hypothetical protein
MNSNTNIFAPLVYGISESRTQSCPEGTHRTRKLHPFGDELHEMMMIKITYSLCVKKKRIDWHWFPRNGGVQPSCIHLTWSNILTYDIGLFIRYECWTWKLRYYPFFFFRLLPPKSFNHILADHFPSVEQKMIHAAIIFSYGRRGATTKESGLDRKPKLWAGSDRNRTTSSRRVFGIRRNQNAKLRRKKGLYQHI